MRKENSNFKSKFLSEPGSQIKNTDYFAFVELDDYACYCLADGIDRDRKKESAKLVVEEAIRTFLEKPKCNHQCLKRCMMAANKMLVKEAKEMRLEASLLIVITDYKSIMWSNAGNVRLYHIRNAVVKHRSYDQSLSQNLVKNQKIPMDKVEEHAERHNLFCYLGMPEKFYPDYSKKIPLQDADSLILCTKGIWQLAGQAEFLDSLDDAKEPEDVCDDIEELILARRKKELDSYTIVCVFIEKVYKDSGKKKKIVKKIIMIAIPIVLAIAILCIVLYMQNKKKEEKISSMLAYEKAGIEYIEEDNYTRALKEFEDGLASVKSVKMKSSSKAAKGKEETKSYKKLSELMVDASLAVDKKDYKKAISIYESAIRYALLNLELEEEQLSYMNDQKKLAITYLDILQHIQTGEKYDMSEAYKDAIIEYTIALKLASEIYDVDGKEEARKKLTDAKLNLKTKEADSDKEDGQDYEDLAEKAEEEEQFEEAKKYYKKAEQMYKKAGDTDKTKEMKEKVEQIDENAKEQEEQEIKDMKEKEKENYKAYGDAKISMGDAAAEKRDYETALKYYNEAISDYITAEAISNITAVQVKISATEIKNTDQAKKVKKAEEYEEEAKKHEISEEYGKAYVLWGLASDLYSELGMKDKEIYTKEKAVTIENSIEGNIEEGSE